MRLDKFVFPSLIFGLCLTLSIPAAAAETTTFGPVHLKEGQKFELCASARSATEPVSVLASFHPVNNAYAVIRSQETILDPGEGGCISVDFSEVGEVPIFAQLRGESVQPDSEDLVASACLLNGIFIGCLNPVEVVEVEPGGSISEEATFGPVRLKPDSALEVCVNNAVNVDSAAVTVAFFRGRDSSEPFATKSGTLQPGQGACFSVGYDRVRSAPVFAEITYQVNGVSGPSSTIVRGVAVINGIYEPVPGKRRLKAVL